MIARLLAKRGCCVALFAVLLLAQGWRRNWDRVIPFFAFSQAILKLIYTTNALESRNSHVRKAIRNTGRFSNDEPATKLIWLALRGAAEKWKNPPTYWHDVKNELAIQFEERFILGN
jgi:putative transposase